MERKARSAHLCRNSGRFATPYPSGCGRKSCGQCSICPARAQSTGGLGARASTRSGLISKRRNAGVTTGVINTHTPAWATHSRPMDLSQDLQHNRWPLVLDCVYIMNMHRIRSRKRKHKNCPLRNQVGFSRHRHTPSCMTTHAHVFYMFPLFNTVTPPCEHCLCPGPHPCYARAGRATLARRQFWLGAAFASWCRVRGLLFLRSQCLASERLSHIHTHAHASFLYVSMSMSMSMFMYIWNIYCRSADARTRVLSSTCGL